MNTSTPGVETILAQAVEIAAPDERQAYVEQACGGDRALERRVERLIANHFQAGSFLERPAVAMDPDGTAGLEAAGTAEGPGSVIGPYKLLEQIGEGGMGVVYMTEQTQPVRRKVALKIIKPGMDTKQVIVRFEAERQALALMDHPNIAKVLDAGATGSGRPYFVMELVKGIPITDYCDQVHLSIPERLDLFMQVCKAVQHAHQKGIIHRDLKPTNVLITLHDGVPVPKVIDFGVAKATGQQLTEKTLFTAFAQMVGTPLYMSPEQAALYGLDIDTRSDIYSLGVLLYELLTGTTPFDAATFRAAAYDEIRRIIREQEPPTPSRRISTLEATATTISANRQTDARRLRKSLGGELDWIVMKALEKDRRRRYETANDFAADVMRYLTDKPVEACPPSGWYRFSKYARRNRVVLTTSAVVALALVAGTAVATWQAIRATRAVTLASKREREAQSAAAQATQARTLATQRQREAQRAAAESKRAAAESKAILTFLVQDMLGASVPYQALGRDVKVADGLAKGRDVKVAEVLANAEKKIDTAFPNQPLVEAGVRHALGSVRRALGQYDLASRHASRSYELRRDLLGPEHPETLASMDSLSLALVGQRKLDDAQKLREQALEIRRRVLGPEHPDTLHSMSGVADLLANQGKGDDARKLFEQVLEIERRVLGPEHPDTLSSMFGLAVTLLRPLGKLDEARELHEQVLEKRSRVLGPEHPRTLKTMHSLGEILRQQGKLDESRELQEQTLERYRRILGPEHPDTMWSMDELALVLSAQGKMEEAGKLDEQILEIRRRTLGPEHPWTLHAMNHLGDVFLAQGRHDEARKLWEQDVETKRRTVGPEHPGTLASMHKLADVFLHQGKVEEARKLREEILEIQRRTLGPEHPDTLSTLAQLGVDHLYAGRPDEAARLMEDALRRAGGRTDALAELKWVPNALAHVYDDAGQFEKAEPHLREELTRARAASKEAPRTAGVLALVGSNLLRQKKFVEAEPPLRECLAIRAKTLPDNWLLFNTQSMLGEALLGQRKLTEAEPLVVHGYERLKARAAKIPATGRARLPEAATRVVRLYVALNQPGKAAGLLRKEDLDAMMPNGVAAFAPPSAKSKEHASP